MSLGEWLNGVILEQAAEVGVRAPGHDDEDDETYAGELASVHERLDDLTRRIGQFTRTAEKVTRRPREEPRSEAKPDRIAELIERLDRRMEQFVAQAARPAPAPTPQTVLPLTQQAPAAPLYPPHAYYPPQWQHAQPGIGEADVRPRRQGLFGTRLGDALRTLDRRWDWLSVHGRAPQADVLNEKLAVRIEPQPQVLARHLRTPGDSGTSTQGGRLPPRPIETESLRIRKTCAPCSSEYVSLARSRLSRVSRGSTARALGAIAGAGLGIARGVGGAATGLLVAALFVVLVAVRRPAPTTLRTIRVVGVPVYSAAAGIASVETIPI